MKPSSSLRRVALAASLVLTALFTGNADAARAPRKAAVTCYDLFTCLSVESGSAYTVLNIVWQGVSREVLVLYPTTMTAAKAPALVLLHAKGVGTTMMSNISRASRLSAQRGYWVVLPSAQGDWDISPNQTSGKDDVGFLSQVINQVTTQFPIDATRISMAGFSKGAYLTEVMACEKPELLASVAMVSGLMTGPDVRACTPSRPLPTLYIMGNADPQVPYLGAYGQYSAAQTFDYWVGMLGCDSARTVQQNLPVLVNDTTSVIEQSNAACTSGGAVDFYTIVNGGHTWPGGPYTSKIGLGIVSQNLDATMVIADFAQKWTTASTH